MERSAPRAQLLDDAVDLIAFDFDGVLTDNKVLVFADGSEAVLCDRSDGLAFDAFRAAGIPTVIVSTERHEVVRARAAKLRTPVLHSTVDKRQALAEHCSGLGIDPKRVIFVGNDVNDLGAMALVGYPIAVADAHDAVKAAAWTVLTTKGGDGVAREIAARFFGIRIGDG